MKKIKYSLNEADLEALKDAIINRVEYIDDDVQATTAGNDIVVSVFEKVVLLLVDGKVPFIIEREDLSSEEQDLVNELYDSLNIEVEDDESGDELDDEGAEDSELEDDELDNEGAEDSELDDESNDLK